MRPLEQMQERFACLRARAAGHGVTIGVEPCAWSHIGTVDEAAALIFGSGVAHVGLFLDPWHLYRRGYDYARLADPPPEMVVGVQLHFAKAYPLDQSDS